MTESLFGPNPMQRLDATHEEFEYRRKAGLPIPDWNEPLIVKRFGKWTAISVEATNADR